MDLLSDSVSKGRGRALLLTASTGCAMTVFDTNVVGISLPAIARDLNATFAEIEWVISAFVLCFATLLLPAGSIADRYGRKRLFLVGIGLFAVASLACGMAYSATSLYIARAIQGVGAAFLLAPALAIIGHSFHRENDRARAWAIWGGVMGLTMVIAPLIGGVINSLLGWRWAFMVNLPICVLLWIAVIKTIEESRDPTPRALDFPGMLTFTGAMFSITCALILGPEQGWASSDVVILVVSGICLFGLFILIERRSQDPMLDLMVFRAWPFVGAVVAMFAYAASAQVMASLLPLFLQNARGTTALMAGVAMLPFSLAMLLLPHVGRKLARWLASYQILTLGLVIVAAGNLMLVWAADTNSQVVLIVAMAVLGSGGGLLNGETQKAIMGTVPRDRAGMASGISTTARFSGMLLGFAGLGAALASGIRSAVTDKVCQLTDFDCSGSSELASRIMAGDFDWVTGLYGQSLSATLLQSARASYAEGFANTFLAAALLAGIAASIVYGAMRRTRQEDPILSESSLANQRE